MAMKSTVESSIMSRSQSSTATSVTDYLIRFLCYTIITVLIVVIFLCVLAYFKRSRRLQTPLVYFTRFFIELVIIIVILPTGQLAGELFSIFFESEKRNATNIVFFVLSLIWFLILEVLCNITSSLIYSSAYLSVSPFSSFDPKPFINMAIGNPIFNFLSLVLSHFNSWLQHPLVVIHMIYTAFLAVKFARLPFIKLNINIIFLGVAFWQECLDVMYLIGLLFKNPNQIACSVMIPAFLILGIVASVIFFKIKLKKIRKDLIFHNEEEEVIQEKEKCDRLESIKLDRNYNKMVTYMNYVVMNHKMKFYEVPMFRYILKCFPSTECLCYLMRIAAFLPPMTSSLAAMIREASKRHDLKLRNKFLLFQLQKIRILRQTSSSEIALKSLKELKTETKDLETIVLNFWHQTSLNVSDNYALYLKIQKLKSKWDESLIHFPNSCNFNEEYCTFLIECCTSFSNAIKIQNKINMIESGFNFSVDNCYRQFIRNFPEYVKLKILDLKGQKVKQQVSRASKSAESNQSSSSRSTISSSQSSEMDIALQEEIGKTMLTNARIRISMENALKNRKADKNTPMIVVAMILILVGVVIFCFIYISFNSYFDQRPETTTRITYINTCRLSMFTAAYSLLMEFSNNTNIMTITNDVDKLQKLDGGYDEYIGEGSSWAQHASDFNVEAANMYVTFVSNIADFASTGENVRKFAVDLFAESTPFLYCSMYGDPATKTSYQNMQTITLYLIFVTSQAVGNTNFSNWFFSNQNFCIITENFHLVADSFNDLMSSISLVASEGQEGAAKELGILELVFPIFYVVFTMAIFLLVSILYVKEVLMFQNMILHQPQEIINEATRPLKKSGSNDEVKDGRSDLKASINIPVLFSIVFACVTVAIALVLFFHLQKIDYYNTWFDFLSMWSSDSRIRKSFIIQIIYRLFLVALSEYPMLSASKYVNHTELISEILSDSDLLDEKTTNIFTESGGTPSIAGLDDVIDEVSLLETCEPNLSQPSFHENYKCASTQALISFFINQITNALNIREGDELIDSQTLADIFHLATHHLVPKLLAIDAQINTVINRFNTDFKNIHIVFFVVEIILAVVSLLICFIYILALNKCYEIAMLYLRRISPISVVSDKKLINYILSIKKSSDTAQMSLDKNVIHHWSSCVICTDNNGTVDSINPAVTDVFGYKPEQLLGQPLLTVIKETEQNDLMNQMKLMKNKQSPSNYTSHCICISDSDMQIPCELQLLAMFDSDSVTSELTSFVSIFSDENEL
ncbi:hypothetical protein TRFO_29537 [Tritrichomonas foetus]|uniref:PAS domain-containing protein n=1 Tax=Tritrichomonas foetus TaxID=1144522 RepID=A0A1J4JZY0_9EUKA|nr:hypothetical protein TRFO_29537 [Tritrichomonas foetus]|eukprot:OHT03084.1 hypothetical protein TRFO_29537 [Tritrichomonas foetus]